ncbi:hypothetical protein D3C71_965410 [compost metagenome]
MRAGRAGYLHPPLQRRRFSWASGIHRSGNPPYQPRRRYFADAASAPRRSHRVPVHRAARRQSDQRRLQPAARTLGGGSQQPADAARPPVGALAGGPAHGTYAAGSGETRQLAGSADRRQRHVDPGPARASAGASASGGSGPRPVERRRLGLRRARQPVARIRRATPGADRQPAAQLVPQEFPELPAPARMARFPSPVEPDLPRHAAEPQQRAGGLSETAQSGAGRPAEPDRPENRRR